MAEGLGLLAAAQTAASNIPYKNLALDNPAEIFLNAFAKGAAINHQKLALEQQIAALNYRMQEDQRDNQFQMMKFNADQGYRAQQFEFDKKKFAAEDEYRSGQLRKAYDKLDQDYSIANRRLGLAEDVQTIKAATQDNILQGTKSYSDAMTEAANKYGPGTDRFQTEFSRIYNEHSSVTGTKEGKDVTQFFTNLHKTAAEEGHKSAKWMMDVLNNNLSRSELKKEDLGRAENEFVRRKTKTGQEVVFIPEYPTTVDVGGQKMVQWNRISPEEFNKAKTEDNVREKYPGLRTRRMPAADYDVNKQLYNRINELASAGLGGPATGQAPGRPNVGDKVTLKNGQTVVIKSVNPDGTFDYE